MNQDIYRRLLICHNKFDLVKMKGSYNEYIEEKIKIVRSLYLELNRSFYEIINCNLILHYIIAIKKIPSLLNEISDFENSCFNYNLSKQNIIKLCKVTMKKTKQKYINHLNNNYLALGRKISKYNKRLIISYLYIY